MVRVDSPSHSVYHAEFFNSKGIKEAKQNADAPVTKKMDEWDYQQKKYKKNFCQLYEYQHSETSTAYTEQTFTKHKTVLHRLDRKLNNFFNDYQKVRQQQDGEELDLDAVTDRFADIHAGHTPNDNIFLSKRKKIKDLAILILTDISLSTDGYVSGYKIIDTEKQSLLLFGEILSKQGTNFQLDTFSSRTRNYCEYQSIKRFDEDWTAYKHKVGAITPKGYTRIGAAIRNAHEHLKKTDSRKKWLLLLTDGKPNDYDRYEGKYGIEDVKQAVQEVRKNNIYISALAIDSNAKFYLPQMLGKDAFRLVHRPNLLPDALIDFYLKVAR
jgi:nitric oxide reductase NorD protein